MLNQFKYYLVSGGFKVQGFFFFLIAVVLPQLFGFDYYLLIFLALIFIITIFSKNMVVFLFVLIGLSFGSMAKMEKDNNVLDFPKKGFVDVECEVTGFPQIDSEMNYRIKSYDITIVSGDLKDFYKGCGVKVRGTVYRYENKNGYSYTIYAKNIELTHKGFIIYEYVNRLRNYIVDRIMLLGDTDLRDLSMSLILGNKNFLSYSVRQSFNLINISHLLALSGLHIGLFSFFIFFILKRILNRKVSYIIASFLVLLYVAVAGFSPSIMRAGVMFIVFNLLWGFRDEVEFLDVLAFSAFILLLYSPSFIFDAGFWLSYLAVFGIYITTDIFKFLFKPALRFEKVSELVSMTLAANIFTLPVIFYLYNGISAISIVSNLIMVPLFFILLITVFISFFFVVFTAGIALDIASSVVSFIWNIMQRLSDALSTPQIFYIKTNEFPIYMVYVMYILMILFLIALKSIQKCIIFKDNKYLI